MRVALLAAAAAVALPAVAHAAWTKTWAIEWYEPAMYYGAKDGVIEPGSDCPKGTNPELDWVKELVDAGYSEAEAKWLRNPANPTRSAVHGQNQMAFRGADRANVYVNPTSAPDHHLQGVTGKLAEGLDLDHNPKTGFRGVDGTKGVDNAFYKTLGCWKTYRGPPRKSSGAMQFNESMREGAWTLLVVASGSGNDPMNDPNVTVGIYGSPDKLVKDGNGDVASDYTFRVKPDQKFEAVFKARTVKGVIASTVPTDAITIRDPGYARELPILKAEVKLTMKPDGSLKGYLGGYRPWMPVYQGWVGARGPVIESLTWVRLPDVYYALKRGADYSPAGPKGEKTHISFAMRIEAVPAFVMTPDAKVQVADARSYKAVAPPTPPPPAALGPINVVDGIVVPRGKPAVSQTAEMLQPPKDSAAGGGGQ